MPRKARVRSGNGIYHVLVQGRRGDAIFGTSFDKKKYMEKVYEYKTKYNMDLYAFCILDNHAHLIVGEGDIDITGLMRRLGISYSHWFKGEHTVGEERLYRGRFLSQPVALWELPALISYVEREPAREGLCRMAFEYPFSSAVCVEDSVAEEGPSGKVLEVTGESFGCTVEDAREALMKRFGTEYAFRVRQLGREDRDSLLRELRFTERLSIKAVAEASGIGRGVVQRIKKN